jgi:hypothetical protein
MFTRMNLRAIGANRTLVPLAFSHPRHFMASLPDPTKCPDGIPPDLWGDVLKVNRAINATFEDRSAHLDYLGDQAGRLVSVPRRLSRPNKYLSTPRLHSFSTQKSRLVHPFSATSFLMFVPNTRPRGLVPPGSGTSVSRSLSSLSRLLLVSAPTQPRPLPQPLRRPVRSVNSLWLMPRRRRRRESPPRCASSILLFSSFNHFQKKTKKSAEIVVSDESGDEDAGDDPMDGSATVTHVVSHSFIAYP